VFDATVLLGQLLQSGISNSTRRRLDQGMGPEGIGQPGGPLDDPVGEDGGGLSGRLGGLAETATEFTGADQSAPGANPLERLGASTGAVRDGGGSAMPPALGKDALALLGGLELREAGANAEALDFILSELKTSMDLDGLIRSVPSEHLPVQLYAASLLAIENGY
jgi:hypothetical protein